MRGSLVLDISFFFATIFLGPGCNPMIHPFRATARSTNFIKEQNQPVGV